MSVGINYMKFATAGFFFCFSHNDRTGRSVQKNTKNHRPAEEDSQLNKGTEVVKFHLDQRHDNFIFVIKFRLSSVLLI